MWCVSHQLDINLSCMENISVIGVMTMTTERIEGAYLVKENVNGNTFLQFIQRSLLKLFSLLMYTIPN